VEYAFDEKKDFVAAFFEGPNSVSVNLFLFGRNATSGSGLD
jgi:hypothetical protein